jgi:inner membrane protein
MTSEPPVLPSVAARRRSWLIKIVCIVALLALLHIPLAMTHGVLRERQTYQAQATDEITGVWGREQRIIGPVLAVPYTYKAPVTRTKLVNGQWMQVEEAGVCAAVAHFLPDELQVDGTIEPEIRRRGIYDAVVYTARLKLNGSLRPDFAAAGIEADHIDWEKARLLFDVSDLHGLRSVGPLHGAESAEVAFEPAEAGGASFLPLAASATVASGQNFAFSFDAIVQGSGTIVLAPVGKNTTVTLHSSWPDPSFTGAWLPVDRRVNDTGFTAEWRVSPFSRGFAQSWSTRQNPTDIGKRIDAASFGVRFARGINGYAIVERAQKYGILFFVLIFAVYFLFEVTAELRIHPLQYAMVGAGLCLFFLGFLALTEFWSTAAAYTASAGACTGLVSLYSWSFLRTGWRTLVVLGGLAATYGYLYFVLNSQDYALIAGTAALFAALGIAMFFTRRINWYALDANSAAKSPAST